MPQSRRERCLNIADLLEKEYGASHCPLIFHSPFQLLIALILSARTQDECVNRVVHTLFEKYPNAHALSLSDEDDLLQIIKDVTYSEVKVKNLRKTAQIIDQQYGGEVPSDRMTLLSLPGVGSKSVNMLSVEAFGLNAFPVDTHVQRLSYRTGISLSTDVLETEKTLCQFVPANRMKALYRQMIEHGKKCCTSNSPRCEGCCIRLYCETCTPTQKEEQYFWSF